MKKLVLLCLLACSLGLSAAQAVEKRPAADAPPMNPVIWKNYDLSALITCEETTWDRNILSLLPFHPLKDERMSDKLEGLELFHLDEGMIQDMLVSFLGEEQFERQGISLRLHEGELMVSAPAALHGQIAGLLNFLDSWVNRLVDLELEIYAAPQVPPVLVHDGPTLKAWAKKEGLTPLKKEKVSLPLGGLYKIDDGDTRPLVWGYANEIAEASCITQALVSPLFTGLKIVARPHLAADGKNLILSFFGQASRLAQPLTRRDLGYAGMMTQDRGLERVRLASTIDDPAIEFASISSVLPVQAGRPCAVTLSFPHRTGQGSLLVLITAQPRPVPASQPADFQEILGAYDLSHLQAGRFAPPDYIADIVNPRVWAGLEEYNEGVDPLLISMGPAVRFFDESHGDEMESLLEYLEEIHGDAYCKVQHEGRGVSFGDIFFYRSKPVFQRDFAEMAAKRFANQHATFEVAIGFVEMNGRPSGVTPEAVLKHGVLRGAALTPLIYRGSAAAMAGLEGLTLFNYQVDVATRVSMPNPEVGCFLDGSYIHLQHEPGLAADRIRVRICVNRLQGYSTAWNLGGNGNSLGVLDQMRFDRGKIDSRMLSDGQIHVLGSVALDADSGPTTLFVLGLAKPIGH